MRNTEKIKGRAQRYYAENREALLAYQREYAVKNADAVTRRNRAYVSRNREKLRARQRAYYAEHREERSDYQRRYRVANLEELKAKQLAYNEEHREEAIMRSYRQRGMDADYCMILRKDPCSYCGLTPSGGVDHIDPVSKGGSGHWMNLTAACKPCNASKGDEELLFFLIRRPAHLRGACMDRSFS